MDRHITRGDYGGTPYNGLYEDAPPENFRYTKGSRNLSFVFKRAQRANRLISWLYIFEIDSYLKDSAFTAVKKDAILNKVCERGTICR